MGGRQSSGTHIMHPILYTLYYRQNIPAGAHQRSARNTEREEKGNFKKKKYSLSLRHSLTVVGCG